MDEELWSWFLSFTFFKKYRVYFYSLTSWQHVVKRLLLCEIENILKSVEKVLWVIYFLYKKGDQRWNQASSNV